VSTVTVIIPYKNNLKFLFCTLESVFSQTYKNFKILIIYDDEDRSDLIHINKFISKNKIKKKYSIKVILNKKNLGAGESRNIGIKFSYSKYIAFIDSDDVWHKNKLKYQLNIMIKDHLPISHTSYNVINELGKKIAVRKSKKIMSFKNILNSCDIGLSTVIVKKEFLKKNNLKFSKITTKEDYVLWLKVLKKTKYIRGINKNLTNYRKRKHSLSSNFFVSIVNGYKVYKNYMKMGHIESLYRLIILSINYLRKTYVVKNIN
jgi:teichuronic acid biosynthesis glycosyltransferase TuaG